MRYGQLTLIKETSTAGQYSITEKTETPRTVDCTVSSVSRAEVMEGGRIGLNPQYEFKVFAGDYDREELCEYEGDRYSIYRTYQDGDYVELYAEKRKGAAGK